MDTVLESSHAKNEKTVFYGESCSKENMKHLYSMAGIAHVVLDSDGSVLTFNSTAEEVFEIDSDDVIGKNFRLFALPEKSDPLDHMIRTCMRRGFVKDYEIALRTGENRTCWVRVNGKTECVDESDHAAVQLYMQDVTSRKIKDMQNELLMTLLQGSRTSDFDLELTLDTLRHIMGCETAGCITDGLKTESVSSARSNIWDVDDALLHHLFSYGASGSVPDIAVFPDLSSLRGTLQNREYAARLQAMHGCRSLVLAKTGSGWLYFLASVRVNAAEEMVTFIGAVAKTLGNSAALPEKQARTSESITSFDNPVAGIIVTKKGVITEVNDWIAGFTGFTQDQLAGKKYRELIPVEYHDEVDSMAAQQLPDERLNQSIELAVYDSAGKLRIIECSHRHIPMNGNSQDIWYWVDREEKHWLQRQLLQARKMESLGMLSGGIVHDFNNLMASILGYSSLLTEELNPGDPYYDDIQQIHNTSEKATELTTRLMAYAHGSEYLIDDLDVNQLITEVAGILSRTLDKNIMIRAELAPDLKRISADASQIQQVILQVALNARDAMHSGGKMIFETRNMHVKETSAWINQGARPGEYIQIAVSDTGKGMSMDVKEHIFKPHFTTQKGESGKGLGLSMVHEIVHAHHGFISVFSEVDKGTMFKIHFPAKKAPASRQDAGQLTKPALGKETILLVDDEKVSRETARKMLTRYGYKVISAESGRDAAAMHRKYAERVDLIILDTLMPGINTDKIIHHFRQINPDIRILASSGKGEQARVHTMLQGKVSGVVMKPFQVRPLLQSIRAVLNA